MFKIEELRKKDPLYLPELVVFRLGTDIPIPGIDPEVLKI
jgi:preprotein translocase subunit SecY